MKLTKTQAATLEAVKSEIQIIEINGEQFAQKICSRCGGDPSYFRYMSSANHGKCFKCNGGLYETIELVKYLKSVRAAQLRQQRKERAIEADAAIIDVELYDLKTAGSEYMDKLRSAEVAKMGYVGTEGCRGEFEITFSGCHSFETNFGEKVIVFMESADTKSPVVWFTNWSSFPGEFEKGGTYRIRATVKEHGERDGKPQTVVSRLAVV